VSARRAPTHAHKSGASLATSSEQEVSMSLTMIVVIVLVVMLLGGGGYYWRRY
jgi:cobalamin biosynthesis Mg chelatase CobN